MTAESFFQLAIKNIQQRKYEAAIDAFMRSLAQKENWQTYLYLGKTLHTLKQYQNAIEAFNNSLALKEDWKSYQELGRTLSKIDKHRPAVVALNKSIALKEDAQTYQLLGSILDKLGEKEKATRAVQNFYHLNMGLGHILIDPLLGGKRGVTIRRGQIDDITKILSCNFFSFHPSFYSGESEEKQLEPWKHIIHIHIPKCAGTNFERPLTRLATTMAKESYYNKRDLELNCKNFLWHGNFKEKYLLDGYLSEELKADRLTNLQGSFFVNHGAGHIAYFQSLSQSEINAKKICLTRDPSLRLISHINHYRKKTNSKDELLETCKKELFNVMHKYICDYDASGTNEKILSTQANHSSEFDSIDFIDISDNNLISQVKSSFLSATTLPNIVQHHRLNEGSSIAKNNSSLNQNDLEDIYHDLVSKGFLERDKQIDFEFLKKRTKERLEFPEIIHTSTSLHPITYIFPQSGNPKLMRTKDFLADPLGAIKC